MRVIVVGLGVQGHKRRAVAGADLVAVVDPVHPEADYRRVEDVPIASYDAALVCTPDEREAADPRVSAPTAASMRWSRSRSSRTGDAAIAGLRDRARATGTRALYRLQPSLRAAFHAHARSARSAARSAGSTGCRMFYGNGTARLVREFGLARYRGRRAPRSRLASARYGACSGSATPPRAPFRVVSAEPLRESRASTMSW